MVRLILRSVFQGLDDIDKDEDAKQLISREISRFREAYKVAVTLYLTGSRPDTSQGLALTTSITCVLCYRLI